QTVLEAEAFFCSFLTILKHLVQSRHLPFLPFKTPLKG
ncbi:unnamed protein product, partial [marine sediment metagenome]